MFKEFWENNKKQFLISSIIVVIGSMIILAKLKARDPYSLDIGLSLAILPLWFLFLFLLVFGFHIFLNIGDKELWE